jgi:hypothetical protein
MTRDRIFFKKPFKRKILLNKGRESVLCALTKKEKSTAKKHLNVLKEFIQGKKKTQKS